MFFEIIQSIFFDTTFFYLYLGLAMITFVVILVNQLYSNHFMESKHLIGDKYETTKVNLGMIERPLIINHSFVNWLIIAFKRIDEKDDKEDSFSSYFKSEFKIRGGERWNKKTYLQPYENIDL
ncbi:hypothetical protein [Gracilibacillus salinarum]|uniref:Uncharacterized protein n=1 Tax=Gracilibacillus salinarum TaxID=2932255 RepID=A0ABY4GH21_9BACI|nr:hypothetical protein [Gracilibacillus salinarum]UOQ83521.1 hypothetical protein MUN87_12200 [Gracilibacillus salinarum]